MNIPDNMNCSIKRKSGTHNCYTLTFKGLTRGSISAIINALTPYSEKSPVAKDVLDFIKYGIENSGDAELKS